VAKERAFAITSISPGEIEALIAASQTRYDDWDHEKDLARLRNGNELPDWARQYRAVRDHDESRKPGAVADVSREPAVRARREKVKRTLSQPSLTARSVRPLAGATQPSNVKPAIFRINAGRGLMPLQHGAAAA